MRNDELTRQRKLRKSFLEKQKRYHYQQNLVREYLSREFGYRAETDIIITELPKQRWAAWVGLKGYIWYLIGIKNNVLMINGPIRCRGFNPDGSFRLSLY